MCSFLIFTINVNGISFCDDKILCYEFDFWNSEDGLKYVIDRYKTDLVIFLCQKQPKNTYLSNILPFLMAELEFFLYKSDQYLTGDYVMETIIFSNKNFADNLGYNNYQLKPYFKTNYYPILNEKGGISTTIDFSNGKKLKIINAHLPINTNSKIRLNLFSEVINNLTSYKEHYLICGGSLNFGINSINGKIHKSMDEFYSNSSLKALFKEGKNNEGPTFEPSCKLCENWNIDNRYISESDIRWCDRILYRSQNDDLVCLKYESLDLPYTNMIKFDHAIVYGVYKIETEKYMYK